MNFMESIIGKLKIFLPLKLHDQNSVKKDWEYIPTNLNEAISQLDSLLQNSTKQQISETTEDVFITKSQSSIGMWIRDYWELRKGGKLSIFFNSLGIYNPEYMSGIILRSYQRYLQKRGYDLDEQIHFYQTYLRNIHAQNNKANSNQAFDTFI